MNLDMKFIGKKARTASLERISSIAKNKVLTKYISLIEQEKKLILKENAKDVKFAINKKLKKNLIDRLILDQKKLNLIKKSIKKIIKLKDPINIILEKWKQPNGLKINKVSIPIGVIGVIYESRPNVTSDVASLCFKSGNAVILKGGSEAIYTNKILAKLFQKALILNKVNKNFVSFVDSKNRKTVDYILSEMKEFIDVIIPRGGKNLVKRVNHLSRIPVIGHLEGLCHTFVDKDAELNMAINVIHNAKLRNTSICGATETILIHKKIIKKFCSPILRKLALNNCKIYADSISKKYYNGRVYTAKKKDWSTEYLSPIISVKCVKSCTDAINHINKYGTMHTDSIITKNKVTAKKFLKGVKSSIAMHNTSTQFADGGEFGFGGEVGISTNTLPPRGPVGLKQLISYKYEVSSKGKIRK
jgi:glutamate-5-semialdehyde dehydrogenase|tara:strand:+ start:1216 stop:2466 length:1251 start_codon:yes stop_codon:yes gene_type:complete